MAECFGARVVIRLLASAILFAGVAAHAAGPLDSVVASHYPDVLSSDAAKRHLEEKRQQAYVELSSKGVDYIVAAYSNGEIGAMALLEKTREGYRVDQEISGVGHPIWAHEPEVAAADMDADGTPEAIVHFSVPLNRDPCAAWVLRVADGRLTTISPTGNTGDSAIGCGDFVDLDGQGVFDIIDTIGVPHGHTLIPFHKRYVLRNGKYVPVDPLDYHEVFWGGDEAAVTRKFSVSPESLQRQPRLVIINGDERGSTSRVSVAKVTLNGATIASEQSFGQGRATWTVPVALLQQNTITVRVDGKPGSRLTIAVRHD